MFTKLSRSYNCKPKCCINNYEKKISELKRNYYALQKNITINETDMILKPLFTNTFLDVTLINKKVFVTITNKKQNFSNTSDVIDLINEWNMHDTFRRFIIKSMSNANKNKIYKYKDDITWICPLNIYYVFPDPNSNNDNDSVIIDWSDDNNLKD